ncbi:MAG TPA: flavin reductase [Methylocella sp.]|nr:flavin reductase [Methylocella sp.]
MKELALKEHEDMAKANEAAMAAPASPGEGLDPAAFREAMSRVAAAVHIVTTDGPSGLAGITATAVASITAEPPMMLFCINKTSPSAARVIGNNAFCINTLLASHEALAEVFAGRTGHRLDERFVHGEWSKLLTGSPVLRGAAAAFDCHLVEAKEVMTHYIMIGAVRAVELGPKDAALIYAQRKFGQA